MGKIILVIIHIKVNSSFYPKVNNTYLSIEDPQTRDFYEKYVAGVKEEQEFIKWAFEFVKNNINLSQYDLDPLVTYLKTPILLVKNYGVPSETINEIRMTRINRAIIVGGDVVVSESIF